MGCDSGWVKAAENYGWKDRLFPLIHRLSPTTVRLWGGNNHGHARRENLRPRARRLARRLVLAAGVRPAGAAGPQGVHADADRIGRALAPDEQGDPARDPR